MSSSDPRSDEAEKGAYAHLEQSLVAPEEELPTTSATVSDRNRHERMARG
jgi:hypothetical protein